MYMSKWFCAHSNNSYFVKFIINVSFNQAKEIHALHVRIQEKKLLTEFHKYLQPITHIHTIH